MTAHSHENTVPKGALLSAAALVACALIAVASVRLGLVAPAADPVRARAEAQATIVQSRDFIFADAFDGGVTVRDATTGRESVAVPAGSKTGFIRGVMRGLARDRHLRGIAKDAPFRLTRWSNGNLTLSDPATGRPPIELGSFGETNRAAFAALL